MNMATDHAIGKAEKSGIAFGSEEIKAFFEGFVSSLPEGFIAAMKLEVNATSGEYGYITWSAGEFAPLGTDSFHIVGGKIVMQTFAAYMPS